VPSIGDKLLNYLSIANVSVPRQRTYRSLI